MTILFLTYVNRSGSTYLANILSSSADICVCPEGDKLVSIFLEDPGRKFTLTDSTREKLSDVFREDQKLSLWDLKAEVFTCLEKAETNLDAFRSILEHYRDSNKPGAGHVLFKAERVAALMEKIAFSGRTDQGSISLKESKKIFFISLVRDPRAVYASQKSTRMPDTGKLMAGNPVKTSWRWRFNVDQALKAGHYELPKIIVKYEALVESQDKVLQEISGFVSLDLSDCRPTKGDLDPRLSDEEKLIHPRISDSPEKDRINAWNSSLSSKEIYLIDKTCHPEMRKLSYKYDRKKLNFGYELFRVWSIIGLYLVQFYQKIKFRIIPEGF